MVAICEDLPEEHNTVTLDPVLKDANGIPAPKIAYTLSENSRRMLDHAVARATEILRAAGAYDVWHEAPIPEGGWHLMGTARMGTDPARSVVNEWGRSHEVKNLFIVATPMPRRIRRRRLQSRRASQGHRSCWRASR